MGPSQKERERERARNRQRRPRQRQRQDREDRDRDREDQTETETEKTETETEKTETETETDRDRDGDRDRDRDRQREGRGRERERETTQAETAKTEDTCKTALAVSPLLEKDATGTPEVPVPVLHREGLFGPPTEDLARTNSQTLLSALRLATSRAPHSRLVGVRRHPSSFLSVSLESNCVMLLEGYVKGRILEV